MIFTIWNPSMSFSPPCVSACNVRCRDNNLIRGCISLLHTPIHAPKVCINYKYTHFYVAVYHLYPSSGVFPVLILDQRSLCMAKNETLILKTPSSINDVYQTYMINKTPGIIFPAITLLHIGTHAWIISATQYALVSRNEVTPCNHRDIDGNQ
jgi:hypothetical protein